DSGSGDGGTVAVSAADLRIIGGGVISSRTFDQGSGGNVNVMADSLLIAGAKSGIFCDAFNKAEGNAGSVSVRATDIRITDGGQVSSSTYGVGNAGTIGVTADSLMINGGSIKSESKSGAEGNGGSIGLQISGALDVRAGGVVSTHTESSGRAGDINIHAGS